ncbi:hypothetical protein GA0116948_110158 [Chitinophaga costaii]|uniref:Lipoprotein n=1 Tax=Chitinophaga costaii TaxID=1335309 RepID=A0A1C4EZG9_9BACT|nr:hypothetical protein [Chitinophaga costaii]PUZ21509.1 hypothetical protein DCM91_15850 [Chitinophaga costaii]SCC49088.1 hypothetical protein GA0116948_110158 [Chitinophaga costaii]
MKTPYHYKATFAILIFLALMTTGLYSCKKDDAPASTTTVTEADAVELATDAVVPADGGMVLQVNNSVMIYQTAAIDCGVAKDSAIAGSSASGATPSYSYALNWNYLLTCSGVVPSLLTFNFSGESKYDGVHMSSNDSSTGNFVLTGITPTATAYTLNTTYTRNGSQTSKIARNNSFSSKMSIESSNITVDKTSLKILSGEATIAISGSSTSGSSFSYSGTLTFLGNDKATLVLNSGTSYTIVW